MQLPHAPELTPNSVHIWAANLDIPEADIYILAQMLSPDELQRAEKFSFEQHRARFIAGRGILRIIVGKYTGLTPEAILFKYNHFGKPALESQLGKENLYFNISHSSDMALFAFAQSREIGVDIEFINDQTDLEQTGSIAFSAKEMTAIRSLPPEQQRAVFFQYWTRKEALIKATGQGLAVPLQQIDVSQPLKKSIVIPDSTDGMSPPARWHIRDIEIFPGFAAAVASEGDDWQVSFFNLTRPALF